MMINPDWIQRIGKAMKEAVEQLGGKIISMHTITPAPGVTVLKSIRLSFLYKHGESAEEARNRASLCRMLTGQLGAWPLFAAKDVPKNVRWIWHCRLEAAALLPMREMPDWLKN